jgi:hypothetical protein
MTKIAGSGSRIRIRIHGIISQRHGPADPDPGTDKEPKCRLIFSALPSWLKVTRLLLERVGADSMELLLTTTPTSTSR